MTMDNKQMWEIFLKPLQRRQPRRNKDEYDVTTMDSKPSMSRDLALQLEQEVIVGKDELMAYSLSLHQHQEKNIQRVRKNLSQTVFGSEDLMPAPSESSGQSPIYISDNEDENRYIVEREPTSRKHQLDTSEDDPRDCKIPKWNSANESKVDETEELTTHGKTCLRAMNTYPPALNSSGSSIPSSGGSPLIPQRNIPPSLRPFVTMSSTEVPSGFLGSVQSSTPKDRPQVRPTRVVDHRSTCLSKWTFDMFTQYVEFEKYVRELNVPTKHDCDVEKLTSHIKALYEDVLNMFGAKSLKDCMFRESNIRVLLNGLILKLCTMHNIHLQTEDQSKLRYLPTGKFDYLFSTKDGRPIGCLEAKSPYSMDKKAFAQAVLELNLVQQIAHKKGSDIETTPFFCVLSDGYRFILMQIKGRELLLEHTRESGSRQHTQLFSQVKKDEACPDATIRIRRLDGEDDLRVLVKLLSNMIDMSIRVTESFNLKKENSLMDYTELE